MPRSVPVLFSFCFVLVVLLFCNLFSVVFACSCSFLFVLLSLLERARLVLQAEKSKLQQMEEQLEAQRKELHKHQMRAQLVDDLQRKAEEAARREAEVRLACVFRMLCAIIVRGASWFVELGYCSAFV